MKKFLLTAIILLNIFSAGATYKAGYYDKMEGLKKEALKDAVKQCVAAHTMLDYTNLPNSWIYTDVYPDLYNGKKRWWEMYSNEVYLINSGQTGLESFRANNMQREHSVPKSWWGSDDSSPAWTDIYNLYPSDGPANQAKSNYPLGPVGTVKFNNGSCKVGIPQAGYGGNSGYVFEPADEYKGDFARAYFYVYTVYDQLNWTSASMGSKNSWPTLKPWAYEMLLQWSRQDPVSQKEINRNDAAERQQGNRNPFIDFPNLAEYIWGTKTTEAFYIADQGGSTPPLTGDPELISPIDGEAIDFGEVAIGSTVAMPVLINGSNLTTALSLLITGTDRSMFTLSSRTVSAADVNAQGGTKVEIVYKPTSEGKHTASLTLYDGGLKNQINVQLIATGCKVPTLSTLTALEATNISESGYTANWTAAPETVDYYVLTRTRYFPDNQLTVAQNCDENSLEVTDRNPDVEESYYVQSSRLGYLSQKSNTIIVSTSSIGTIDMQPLTIGLVEGGILVLNEQGVHDLKVFTPDGKLVYMATEKGYGEFFPLQRGIYLVTSKEARRPLKVYIQ